MCTCTSCGSNIAAEGCKDQLIFTWTHLCLTKSPCPQKGRVADLDCSGENHAIHASRLLKEEYVSLHEGRLELDIIWEQVAASSGVQTEPLNPGTASGWRVHVVDPAHAQTYGHSVFSLHVSHCCSSFVWSSHLFRPHC